MLVVRPDNLGDVVIVTPALRALRAAAPQARLDLLASPAGATVRELIPYLNGMIVVSPCWQQTSATGDADIHQVWREQALIRTVACREYDAMVVFTSATQSPWPAAHVGLLAGINVRAVHSEEFGGTVATHWVTPPPSHTHQVDRCLHLLERIGVPAQGRHLELRVPSAARVASGLALAESAIVGSEPFALLAPGASCPSRRYPAEKFAVMARRMAMAGLPVIVTGSPKEAHLVAHVVRVAGHPNVRPLAQVTVPVLTDVVARASVVVCNNSGCLHLADAMRTPVVVAYAGTERLTDMRPRSTSSVLLRQEVPCSPCRQFTCPYGHECLDIEPTELAAAALRLAAIERAGRATREVAERLTTTQPTQPADSRTHAGAL